MAYELKPLRRQKIQYNWDNSENPVIAQLVLDGAKVTPASATLAVYRRGNTTAILAATAMTVTGTLAKKAVDTTTVATWPIETGYRAEVVFTYGSDTYTRIYILDVVKFLLDLNIDADAIFSLDDRAGGMSHGAYDDLSPLIVSVRDLIQTELEHKALKDKRLVENMILDYAAIANCGRLKCLAQLFMNKGNMEVSAEYMKQYEQLLVQVLAMIKYDVGEDGDEDATAGGIQTVRLVT